MEKDESADRESSSRESAKVDAYISEAKDWQAEIEKLRTIILECGLTEEFKWSAPCYTFEQSNIVIIQGFKKYCALLFFKGALLKDPHGVLVKTGENTRVGRQMRFTDARQIAERETILRAYIAEAIEVEKAGLKMKVEEMTDLVFPEEFQKKLDEDPEFRAAFEALTPGRQRAYNIHFSAAKQSKTRESRIEKCTPKILSGKGLNDR